MFCGNCGRKFNQGELFCANCGNRAEFQELNYKSANKIISNKVKLILGIIFTILGSGITIGTFFFFGPFLGLGFLILGAIFLSQAIFFKVKKSIQVLLTILLTIIVCAVVWTVSFSIWSDLSSYISLNCNSLL